jgi:ElaB/YqjD/DUF883 family membrane-anchored ribosome-binding protein
MADTIKDRVQSAYAKGKSKAETAVDAGKARATKAAKATQANARKAQTATAEGINRNPLAAVAGGLALGIIAAALLPHTKREDKLVGKVGKNVRAKASDAAKTARTTAMETLDSLGVNAASARGQFRDLASKLGEVASTAGKSAADAVRNSQK